MAPTYCMRLLELILGEALPPPTPAQGQMRVCFLENSRRALAFLRANVGTGEGFAGWVLGEQRRQAGLLDHLSWAGHGA